MHNGNYASLNTTELHNDCPFCQPRDLASYILKETAHYRLVTDHAPLVEGHLLIMPKSHYTCYGAVPAALDAELLALKHEVQRFFAQYYAPAIFWEHGVFRQTVFHAHLHCFPFGEVLYAASMQLHELIVRTQEDIRSWYDTHGHYFYLDDREHGYLFAPTMEIYLQVAGRALWSSVVARYGKREWRSAQQRQEEGMPLIEATKTKWLQFQQAQGVFCDNETRTR
jgi:diadenosine tetraphosphate (Ap4A) HIT family hydrolase